MSTRMYYSQEAEQQAQRERLTLALLASLLGLSLGAVLAFLFAPQSGDKTRQQLGEQVEHAVAPIKENAGDWRNTVEKRIRAVGE